MVLPVVVGRPSQADQPRRATRAQGSPTPQRFHAAPLAVAECGLVPCGLAVLEACHVAAVTPPCRQGVSAVARTSGRGGAAPLHAGPSCWVDAGIEEGLPLASVRMRVGGHLDMDIDDGLAGATKMVALIWQSDYFPDFGGCPGEHAEWFWALPEERCLVSLRDSVYEGSPAQGGGRGW